MPAKSGDKARYGRLRKQKLAKRLLSRAHSKTVIMPVAVAPVEAPPKA